MGLGVLLVPVVLHRIADLVDDVRKVDMGVGKVEMHG